MIYLKFYLKFAEISFNAFKISRPNSKKLVIERKKTREWSFIQ